MAHVPRNCWQDANGNVFSENGNKFAQLEAALTSRSRSQEIRHWQIRSVKMRRRCPKRLIPALKDAYLWAVECEDHWLAFVLKPVSHTSARC